jgi:hypothetical protein
MSMDPFLVWLESSWLSQWVVGAPTLLAFPGILALHAIGMGFAVGVSVAVDLRVLGAGAGIPIREMRRFMPVFWAGFWVNAVSGVLLLIGYPTKALTNPVFYVKLFLIAAGVVLLRRILRLASPLPVAGGAVSLDLPPSLKWMAVMSLLCWAGSITAGRLLAYTYTRLTAIP